MKTKIIGLFLLCATVACGPSHKPAKVGKLPAPEEAMDASAPAVDIDASIAPPDMDASVSTVDADTTDASGGADASMPAPAMDGGVAIDSGTTTATVTYGTYEYIDPPTLDLINGAQEVIRFGIRSSPQRATSLEELTLEVQTATTVTLSPGSVPSLVRAWVGYPLPLNGTATFATPDCSTNGCRYLVHVRLNEAYPIEIDSLHYFDIMMTVDGAMQGDTLTTTLLSTLPAAADLPSQPTTLSR